MKNVLIVLLTLLLTSKLSYSQEIYPRILQINGKTVIALSLNQVKQINIVWEHKRFLESENEILNKTLDKYTILSYEKDSLIILKTKEMNKLIIKTKRLTQNNVDLTNENEELNIHLIKIKKRRKIWFISGVGAGIVSMILIN